MDETRFDVFKGIPDKKPLWLGAVPGLQRATEQMYRMATRLPGNYFVLDPTKHEVVAAVQNVADRIPVVRISETEEKTS